MLRYLSFVFLLTTSEASAHEPHLVPADAPSKEIQALIANLGSKHFSARKDAAKALKLRPDSIPFLQRAVLSPDPDLAEQAGIVLKSFQPILSAKQRERVLSYAKNGAIDLAIEVMLAWNTDAEDRVFWQTHIDLATLVAEKALSFRAESITKKITLPPIYLDRYLPPESFARFSEAEVQTSTLIGSTRANRIKIKSSATVSNILVSESLTSTEAIVKSMVFSMGEIKSQSLGESILIGDFDGELKLVNSSILITRGNLKGSSHFINALVISSGSNNHKKDSRIVDSLLIEKEPVPLGFIKWFETSQIGVEAMHSETGIQISKLDSDKEFSKAGCKVGDVVQRVNGDKVESLDQFRRSLRKSFIGGFAKLSLLRENEKVEIMLRFASN